MSKIIVYEHCNFKGLYKEFTSSVTNLIAENFKHIASLKVIGAPWVAYDLRGKQVVYEEGEYASVQKNSRFSSLKMVTEDLTNPQITIYEHANYQGKSLILKEETHLCNGDFDKITSSHKVQSGAWILYEHCDRSGDKMVARAFENNPWHDSFNDKLSYLHPMKPGRFAIKASSVTRRKNM